jgi:hypothetical protein
MTQEQQAIQQYVDQLIEQGNVTILQRNSRARKLPFGARLARGVVNLSPLALTFAIGYAATAGVFMVIEWVML